MIHDQGYSPQVAVDHMAAEYRKTCDKTLGSICLNDRGQWGIGIIGSSMSWALAYGEEGSLPTVLYGSAKGEIFKEKAIINIASIPAII